jgi:hypothetical protein
MDRQFKIRLIGCDDETEISLELSESEEAFVERLEDLFAKASTCVCQPRLSAFRVVLQPKPGSEEDGI